MKPRRVFSLMLCILLAFTLLPATAFADPVFTLSSSAEELTEWLVAPNEDITITGTPTYTGAAGACSKFDSVNFGTIGDSTFALPAGILLTSGNGAPALSSTSTSYGVAYNTAGDTDVQTFASGGTATHDAAVLEFSFTVPENTSAVEFQFMFGSDEYPEYVDSVVDGAIVLVDGVNYAKFSNGAPLAVVSEAELIPNNGLLSIEYDGLSAPKVVTALLDTSLSTHTVKIAIADASDTIYDSGLFLSSMKISHRAAGGVVGSDVLNVEAQIDALPDPVTADDSEILAAQDDILEAKKDYDDLTDYDRSVIDQTKVSKLDKLLVRLDAVLIIDPEDEGVSCEGIGAAVQVPELNDPGTGTVTVALSVTPVSEGNATPNFVIAGNTLAEDDQQILASYDISLIKSIFDNVGALLSQGTVPNTAISGTIKIRLPLPSGYGSGSGLTVAYIDDAGNITLLPTTVVTVGGQKYLEFTTTHFSLYAIIGSTTATGPSGPTGYFGSLFSEQTLIDPRTGIAVSGPMIPETTLQVSLLDADAAGVLGDAVRQHQKDPSYTLYLLAKASLSPDYGAPLSLSIPVGAAYDGQTVTLLQVVNGMAGTLTAVVKNGNASFQIASLESFALFVPSDISGDADIPQTGDNVTAYGNPLLIGMAALAGALVFYRRKRA